MSYSGIGAALALLLSACGGGGSSGSGTTINTGTGTTTTTTPTDVTIQLDAAATGTAVNPLVLGSNVQWVNGGDNLLLASSLTFDSSMVPLVQTMAPTVLRYPGGQQSDLYDWTLGIGPLGSRGTNLQAVSNTPQITYMGSGEMMQLDATVDSAALFTVNVVTGTAAEVVPIASVDDRIVGDGSPGPITLRVQGIYNQAVRGQLPQYESWLTRV